MEICGRQSDLGVMGVDNFFWVNRWVFIRKINFSYKITNIKTVRATVLGGL